VHILLNPLGAKPYCICIYSTGAVKVRKPFYVISHTHFLIANRREIVILRCVWELQFLFIYFSALLCWRKLASSIWYSPAVCLATTMDVHAANFASATKATTAATTTTQHSRPTALDN